MNILVTGATGQLGAAVARALVARGDRVRCLVRDPARAALLDEVDCEQVVGDVTAPETLAPAMQQVEAVFHLAGVVSYWKPKADWVHAVNVGGTRSVLDAAAAAGVRRLVFTSSIAALGAVQGDGIGDEQTAWNWHGQGIAYLDTKHASDALVVAERRLETVAVNPGIVFGARDIHQNGGRMLVQLAAGAVPAVPPGQTTACVLDDVVAGHLAALDRGRPGERYVLGGSTLSFHELYGRIAAVLQVPAPTRVAPPWLLHLVAAGHELRAALSRSEPPVTRALVAVSCRNRRYRSDKAIAELGYRPSPLEHGIEACAAWYRDQGLLKAKTR